MGNPISRREALARLTAAAALPAIAMGKTAAVAIVRCPSYSADLGDAVATLFNQVGGLSGLSIFRIDE